jgi:hypothetical protein
MKRFINHNKDWELSEDIKTGFQVPENYFKDIENHFSLKLIED